MRKGFSPGSAPRLQRYDCECKCGFQGTVDGGVLNGGFQSGLVCPFLFRCLEKG